VATFIRHEYAVPVGNEIDEIEILERLAVRPATCKIGRPVNPVIQRTCEMEVRRDQGLNCRTILGNIGLVSGAFDCNVIGCLAFFLRHRWFGFG
jgi:hypothetical protein